MNEENEVYSDKDSYLTISKKMKEKEPEEYVLPNDNNERTYVELIKAFEDGNMGENEIYQIFIANNIALNLHLSLNKLKKGQNYQGLFKNPCQIKIYPKAKLMIIYLIVSYNFLRIKTELQYIRENQNFNNIDNKSLSKKNLDLNESPIINIDNRNGEEIIDNEDNEKEVIFTIELIDFYNMLDLLLCQNKDHSIVLCLDRYFSVLTGKSVCSDVYYQIGYSCSFKFNLLKNEVFSYALNKHKNNSNKNIYSQNISNKKSENDIDNDNDSSIDKNSEFDSKNNNKEKKNKNNNNQNNNKYYESQNNNLQKKFTMELNSAKYIIEGSELWDLYCFMKGIDLLYDDFATNNIEISLTNDKAFILCPNMQKIKYGRYIEDLSKNINQQIKLNIKSVINHSFTPLAHGFNSFYRTKFIAKFITSFYNKNDKRLLIKVSPNGKMILSYTFSDPKNDLMYDENNENNTNKKSYSEEINEDGENNDENYNNEQSKKKSRKKIIDRLLDDENRGNIVEMIFYPVVFDISKA